MKLYNSILLLFVAVFVLASCETDDNGNGTDDQSQNIILANLFVTSNTNPEITAFDFAASGAIASRSLLTASADTEGVFYDSDMDELTAVSRTQLALNNYMNIEDALDGETLNLAFSSNVVLESPRDLAVNGDIYVVSDNADVDGDTNTDDGRFYIFEKDGNSFTLRNTVTVEFAVWGIEFIGNDLFAVVDKTSDLAVFTNFAVTNTTDATVAPSKRVTIGGITRTHGIAFDEGALILTDIGDAGSDTDGGFQVISNFQAAFDALNDGDTLAANQQIRVSGNFTTLGNPVSAEYDRSTQTIFIAERANGGGKLLIFDDIEAGGNLAPNLSIEIDGASSLYYESYD
ncbi:hypothetical protein [Candidatus Ulvibacter alkanivorans]|uniref:hypothetical protein n=1 Tax=Candidatus Ulvibacter alkanivorans TaxID=2267620 RepID=UPI000DF3438D|nr:hypothetical protein [Candidatus Ulvibacter alkanivorans]